MKIKSKPIRIDGDIAYITLSKGYEAIIDIDDLSAVDEYNWCANVRKNTVYAQRYTRKPRPMIEFLHRFIAQPDGDMQVDHINGNGLDNRKANLRCVTQKHNTWNRKIDARNKSGFKGVSWHKSSNKWQANIMANGNKLFLGNFDTPEEAHSSYVKASQKFHGQFGRTE